MPLRMELAGSSGYGTSARSSTVGGASAVLAPRPSSPRPAAALGGGGRAVPGRACAEPIGDSIAELLSEEQTFSVHQEYLARLRCNSAADFTPPADTTIFVDVQESENGEWGYWDTMLKHLVMLPHTIKRLTWDTVGCLMVLYDVAMVPLQLFDVPQNLFTSIAAWATRLYWTIDLVLMFFTAPCLGDGTIVRRSSHIVAAYVRSWFAFDLGLVTYEWADFAVHGPVRARSSEAGVRMMRILRIVRLMRLQRLVKNAPEVARSAMRFAHSEALTISAGLLRIMCIGLVFCHVWTCIWYGLAANNTSDDTNWVDANGLQDEPLDYVYAMAFHWCITQFIGNSDITPTNHRETACSVILLLMAFVASGYAIAAITTSMTRLEFLAGHSAQSFNTLNRYLLNYGISNRLAARVLRCVIHNMNEMKRSIPEDQVDMLQLLSKPLRLELDYEVNAPLLRSHPFFLQFDLANPAAMRQICHKVVSHYTLGPSDVLFSPGECTSTMYIVQRGKLVYIKTGLTKQVAAGQWAGEAALWTPWVHLGAMKASTACALLCVNAVEFRTVAVSSSRNGEFYPGKYAWKFVEWLNEVDESALTDLALPERLVRSMVSKIFAGPVVHESSVDARPSVFSPLMRGRWSMWDSKDPGTAWADTSAGGDGAPSAAGWAGRLARVAPCGRRARPSLPTISVISSPTESGFS